MVVSLSPLFIVCIVNSVLLNSPAGCLGVLSFHPIAPSEDVTSVRDMHRDAFIMMVSRRRSSNHIVTWFDVALFLKKYQI